MGKTLLLVDDSMIVRSGLQHMFENSGNWEKVFTANNGQEGLEKIQELRPDVVCMDVEMPVMDGLEALKQITVLKKTGKVPPSLPVFIFSGTLWEDEDQVQRVKNLGAADLMAKPDGASATVMIDFQKLETQILALV